MADARENVVRMEESKVTKGQRLREEIASANPGSEAPARGLLATASFLNFLRWVVAGGFCH